LSHVRVESIGCGRRYTPKAIGSSYGFLGVFVFSLLTRRWLGILVIFGLSCLWTVGSGLKLFLQRRALRRTGLTSPIAGSATIAQVESARDDGYVAPLSFFTLFYASRA
jgi:hypothetical protein